MRFGIVAKPDVLRTRNRLSMPQGVPLAQYVLRIRNTTKATALKIVRMLCSLPQRTRSRWASGESLSNEGSSN